MVVTDNLFLINSFNNHFSGLDAVIFSRIINYEIPEFLIKTLVAILYQWIGSFANNVSSIAIIVPLLQRPLLTIFQQKYESKQKLIRYIISIYSPKAISDKIDCYYLLNFKEFLAELKNQKVKLTASQQMELLPLFENKKNELLRQCQDLL